VIIPCTHFDFPRLHMHIVTNTTFQNGGAYGLWASWNLTIGKLINHYPGNLSPSGLPGIIKSALHSTHNTLCSKGNILKKPIANIRQEAIYSTVKAWILGSQYSSKVALSSRAGITLSWPLGAKILVPLWSGEGYLVKMVLMNLIMELYLNVLHLPPF
jgi:hypothetical protein